MHNFDVIVTVTLLLVKFVSVHGASRLSTSENLFDTDTQGTAISMKDPTSGLVDINFCDEYASC